MAKQKISHVTPGLFAVGDRVRPVSFGKFFVYGYGQIVAKAKNYEIKFPGKDKHLHFREDEIQK